MARESGGVPAHLQGVLLVEAGWYFLGQFHVSDLGPPGPTLERPRGPGQMAEVKEGAALD